jgi:hypothetical protein
LISAVDEEHNDKMYWIIITNNFSLGTPTVVLVWWDDSFRNTTSNGPTLPQIESTQQDAFSYD